MSYNASVRVCYVKAKSKNVLLKVLTNPGNLILMCQLLEKFYNA